jgi:ABC-type transporter Mla MlaB component
MDNTMNLDATPVVESARIELEGLTELVRGDDQRLLEQIGPLVSREDVALDLSRCTRIDAAGISALVSLYAIAREAGHSFGVANASLRVESMLRLVGLAGILQSHNAVRVSHFSYLDRRTAA